MICIIDYGLGNVGSLLNMCRRIGIEAIVSSEKKDILKASHLLLPGVGTFDTGAKNLKERQLPSLLDEAINHQNKPIMGICLGAQLMLESSEEGIYPGLGWIKGKVVKFNPTLGVKIPHMGWNNLVEINDPQLFGGMPDDPCRFYFVHSYHFAILNAHEIIAKTNYGLTFTSAFRRGNIIGVQFHPEKSHTFGMQLLRNFVSAS